MFSRLVTPLVVILLLACFVVEASDPMPSWSHRWSADVWNTYCDLKLDYNIPFRRDTTRRGLFANTDYDQAFVRFTATTRTHSGITQDDNLFNVRFQLYIYGENGELPPPEDRVASASIASFSFDPPHLADYPIHMFSLDERDTEDLLNLFRANERVDVKIRFVNGEERTSTIYPSGDRDFHVWEAMFETCIQTNVGPRR